MTSKVEDEYFFKQEHEKLQALADERRKKVAVEQRAKLKALHWMHCPKCGEEIKTVRYGKIEIDRCFGCGGIWLDDGELEKIIAHPQTESSVMRKMLAVFRKE